MKTRYSLFLTSFLCGLALSFAAAGYVHGGDGEMGQSAPAATANPSALSYLDEQTAFSVATRLVGDRDAALIAHDRTALQALTVPDSPARTIDDVLFEKTGNLDSVNTVVLDVHVLSDKEWEVRSIQQEIHMNDGSSSAGQERCTLWRMDKNPWRLYETGECS